RVVLLKPITVTQNAIGDHLLADKLEDGLALLTVRIEQFLTAPTLQAGSQFPAEVRRVLEAVVEALAAIGWVLVSCVAGDEDSVFAVGVSHHNAQVPEADVVELGIEV